MIRDLVYDVGMNNGDDTAHYLFRGYRVVAIEADPTLVEAARQRFADDIADARLTLLNVAIGEEEGVTQFWIADGKTIWSSLDRASASRMGQRCYPIHVCCRRFSSVLAEYGVPYYLKIDIEGRDHYCLSDLDRADIPKYVSLELSRFEDLFKLRDLGYDRFKIITQNNHSELPLQAFTSRDLLRRRLRRYPRLYRFVRSVVVKDLPAAASRAHDGTGPGWVFPAHSSGPFGEQTAGSWHSLEEVAYTWLSYQLGYSKYGMPSIHVWHDVHATRPD